MQGSVSTDQACRSKAITRIDDALQANKASLKSFRTEKLWIQYMDMVDILRYFIRTERTCNWDLHIKAVSEMLPYLAASGHNNYTKSALIYLQPMSCLQDDIQKCMSWHRQQLNQSLLFCHTTSSRETTTCLHAPHQYLLNSKI